MTRPGGAPGNPGGGAGVSRPRGRFATLSQGQGAKADTPGLGAAPDGIWAQPARAERTALTSTPHRPAFMMSRLLPRENRTLRFYVARRELPQGRAVCAKGIFPPGRTMVGIGKAVRAGGAG